MKNLLLLAIFGAIAWFGYGKYKEGSERATANGASVAATSSPQATESPIASQQFSCDGRTHCSHMRSCEEAKYFIQNCPNTKMDGNNDGVPCERQWCN